MKILTEGHKYVAANFENPENGQTIQFIEKYPAKDFPEHLKEGRTFSLNSLTDLITASDGTTNEELLEILLNRLNYLNNKFPCRENSIAITHLDTALLWLNKRTQDRVKRGVEGKQIK